MQNRGLSMGDLNPGRNSKSSRIKIRDQEIDSPSGTSIHSSNGKFGDTKQILTENSP